MRNKTLSIAVVAGAIFGAPLAAQAQDVIGVVRGGPVVVNPGVVGIAVDRWPAFREYIVREHVPSYAIPGPVFVGAVLPETGVVYYDLPQTFGVLPYRYTVVNSEAVLVEPRSRRIVQVLD